MTMTRKQFLKSVMGAGVGVVAVSAVGACGGDDDGGGSPDAASIDAPAGVCAANPTSTIGTNHGHTLMVSLADVTAAADKTYDITGSSGHAHSVTISGAMFTMLHNTMTVMVVSTSGGGHTHNVTVMCG